MLRLSRRAADTLTYLPGLLAMLFGIIGWLANETGLQLLMVPSVLCLVGAVTTFVLFCFLQDYSICKRFDCLLFDSDGNTYEPGCYLQLRRLYVCYQGVSWDTEETPFGPLKLGFRVEDAGRLLRRVSRNSSKDGGALQVVPHPSADEEVLPKALASATGGNDQERARNLIGALINMAREVRENTGCVLQVNAQFNTVGIVYVDEDPSNGAADAAV